MKIYCPHCSYALESDVVLLDGQHVLCPHCNEKFAYKITMSISSRGIHNKAEAYSYKGTHEVFRKLKGSESLHCTNIKNKKPIGKMNSPNGGKMVSLKEKVLMFFSYLSWFEKIVLGVFLIFSFVFMARADIGVKLLGVVYGGVVVLIIFRAIRRIKKAEEYVLYLERLYMRYLRWNGAVKKDGLRPVLVNMRLWHEEEAYMVFKGVKLFEERVTGTSGDFLGYRVSENVMIGGSGANYVRNVDFIAQGDLCLSNKRLIFVGDSASRSFLWEDVIKSSGKEDFCDIWTERNGRSQFVGVNGWICNDVFDIFLN